MKIYLKEYDKISTCKEIEIEISKTWYLKISIIPMIIRALGMIKKGIGKNYQNPCLPLFTRVSKLYCVELLMYSGDCYRCTENINTTHLNCHLTSEFVQIVSIYLLPYPMQDLGC